jgi:hypothetical protein
MNAVNSFPAPRKAGDVTLCVAACHVPFNAILRPRVFHCDYAPSLGLMKGRGVSADEICRRRTADPKKSIAVEIGYSLEVALGSLARFIFHLRKHNSYSARVSLVLKIDQRYTRIDNAETHLSREYLRRATACSDSGGSMRSMRFMVDPSSIRRERTANHAPFLGNNAVRSPASGQPLR